MAIDYNEISMIFAFNGYEWRQKDGLNVIPDAALIEENINKMKQALIDSGEDECQITMGHLILQKSGVHFDLYVHLGSEDA